MNQAFIGTWKIVEMEKWDLDFIDLIVPGYFRFDKHGNGEFEFGAVHGILICVEEEMGLDPRIGFSWEGSDECDPARGKGWVKRKGNGIKGKIRFRDGDSSRFKAERMVI